MANPFDQLGKKIALRALLPSGPTVAQHEIPSNAHHADLRHDPDPARQAERARLGLLGRLASVACLIEIFSSAPGEDQVLRCVGKLIAFRFGEARPPAKPFLWIIAAGRPSRAISSFAAVPAPGWPPGVYVSPGTPEPAGMLRVGIVVATELPRERSTLLVRIMAGGAGLPAAIADLAALPADAIERVVASADVLELRRLLGNKPDRTVEEEIIVSMQDPFDEIRDEGRVEGRKQGEATARARDVLTVLRARGIAVADGARERILTEKSPERLERWLEKAVVVASVAEVIDDPS